MPQEENIENTVTASVKDNLAGGMGDKDLARQCPLVGL